YGIKGKLTLAESLGFFRVRGIQKLSVQGVSPKMIGATDAGGAQHTAVQLDIVRRILSGFGQKTRTAVATHVVMPFNVALFRTREEKAVAQDVQHEDVAG